jgi:hypothetical protein
MKDRSKHWCRRLAVAVTLAAGLLLLAAPAMADPSKWVWI